MADNLLVPLKSIMINRDGPVDALALFQQTGLAVRFTPGEVEMLSDQNDGDLSGVLREPTSEENPFCDAPDAADAQ